MYRVIYLVAASAVAALLAVVTLMSGTLAQAVRPSVVVPGTWSMVPSADPGSTAGGNTYLGVSCVGPNFCIAVGTGDNNSSSSFIAGAEWNGSAWHQISLADADAPGGIFINAISCSSPTFCMAVGQLGASDTLVGEIWNGQTWTVANLSTNSPAQLTGVSCKSPTFCVAVGTIYPNNFQEPLAVSWNGSALALDVTPPGFTDAGLNAVSCAAVGTCQAVGANGNGAMALGLNGSTWSIEPTPTALGSYSLSSISCLSALFCEAVGGQNDQALHGGYANLAEQWNGTAWSMQSTPDSNPVLGDGLEAVDCFGPTSCVAGGWVLTNTAGTTVANAALAWNGSTWASQGIPAGPISSQSQITALSCVPNNLCLAVGGTGVSTEALVAPIYRPGYAEVASDGGLFSFGAPFYGSMGGLPLNKPIVGMAMTPDGGGYYEVASDGGIFAFGDATFYGSMGGKPLNEPIVGMVPTLDGQGYYEVASDGGIFAFGDATFYGSMGGLPLNKPIVGIAATPDGGGYYEVASDGGIFAFGDATFSGSMGGKPLNEPIVGIAATSAGGYYEVASDGGLFAFGNGAPFLGSMGGKPLNEPIVGMTIDPAGGYYEVASDGGIFAFGGAPFLGSMGGKPLNEPVVGIAN